MFVFSLSTALQSGIHGKIPLVIRLKVSRGRQLDTLYVLNDYSTSNSVSEMLKSLNWQTLEHRRIRNSLIMLLKIKFHLVAVDHHHLTETRNLNFFVPYSLNNYHMNSYFPRTIRYWNSLPYSLKASTSLCEFTSGLLITKSLHVLAVVNVVLLNFIIIYVHALTSLICHNF